MNNNYFKYKKLKSIDFIFIFLIMILIAIGIICVYSAQQKSIFSNFSLSNSFIKHIINIFIGILVFLIAFFLPLKKLNNTIIQVFLSFITILALFFVILYGKMVNGASRWISIGILNFQPSELAKIVLIFFSSYYISKRKAKNQKNVKWTWGLIIVVGSTIALVGIEPDVSTAMVFLLIILAYFFLGNVPLKFSAVLFGSILVIGLILLNLPGDRFNHVEGRINSYVSTIRNLNSIQAQPQILNSQLAYANGGIFGRGLGNGELKNGSFIPEIDRDMIIAGIGEEMGMIGVIIVISIYLVILYIGFKITSLAAKFDNFFFFLSFGISINIFIYAIVHAFISVGFLPSTGLPLPFISYGGSAMITNFFLIGILLNISSFVSYLDKQDRKVISEKLMFESRKEKNKRKDYAIQI